MRRIYEYVQNPPPRPLRFRAFLLRTAVILLVGWLPAIWLLHGIEANTLAFRMWVAFYFFVPFALFACFCWAFCQALLRIIQYPYARDVARTAWRMRHGLCPECGYDLRATPRQCPECGARQDGGSLPPAATSPTGDQT